MQRSGGSRRSKGRSGGSGILRLFAGPVGFIAVILGLVIAVGVWGKEAPPATKPAENTQQQAKQPQPEQPKPTQPATPAGQPPVQAKPTEPDNSALLAKRKHIDRAGANAKTMLVTVYYADGLTDGTSLQPVEVRVPQSESVAQVTAEQVIAAPTDLKLYSSVPAGTKVKSVNFNRATGVVTVDLSAEAADVQGTEAAMNMRASFVYSLTALKDVKAVQLWVNGKPAMLHGIEWSQPLSREQLQERSSYKVEPVIKFVP